MFLSETFGCVVLERGVVRLKRVMVIHDGLWLEKGDYWVEGRIIGMDCCLQLM